MVLDIEDKSLKHGVLGLVIALVEVIRDALQLQALRRMEGGSLTEVEVERLGQALMDLDAAIEQIKQEQGVAGAVRAVRDGMDNAVESVLEQVLNPREWVRRAGEGQDKCATSLK